MLSQILESKQRPYLFKFVDRMLDTETKKLVTQVLGG